MRNRSRHSLLRGDDSLLSSLNPLLWLDRTGLPRNLIANSVAPSGAYHGVDVATVTSSGNVWSVTFSGTYGKIYQFANLVPGQTYRMRVEIRRLSGNTSLRVGPYYGNGDDYDMRYVYPTSTWQLVDFVFIAAADAAQYQICFIEDPNPDGWGTVEIRNPQLTLGSAPKTYYPTIGLTEQQTWRGQRGSVQLGSTTGADANDPSGMASGLSFDGVDDFAQTQLNTGDMSLRDWTIFAAFKATASGLFGGVVGVVNPVSSNRKGITIGAKSEAVSVGFWEFDYDLSTGPTISNTMLAVLRYRKSAGMLDLTVGRNQIKQAWSIPYLPVFTGPDASTFHLGSNSGSPSFCLCGSIFEAGLIMRCISDTEIQRLYDYSKSDLAKIGEVLQ